MRCGLYEIDITPKLGENIPGYFEARPACGIREPLFARALACSNEAGAAFVLVNMDTISCDARTSSRARARFEQLTGVSGANMMVSATHTHTGGPVDEFVPGTANYEYMDWMADRAADVAAIAWSRRQPAKLGFGTAREAAISFNRRYEMKDGSFQTNPGFRKEEIQRPVGAIDPEVTVLKIEDIAGKLIGVVTNFACHLDTVSGNRYSPDYPGELGRVLKSVYGQELVSIFLTGACGNINHFDFMHRTREFYTNANPPHYKKMGQTLAGDVLRALAFIQTEETEALAVENGAFPAEIRTPTPEEVAQAKNFLKENPYLVVRTYEHQPYAGPENLIARHYARSLITVSEIREKRVSIPVQVARIGKAAIAGMPCELFVEFGLDIKARSGFEYPMISTLTNAHFGYLAVREAFDQGGYETTISGDTMMSPETGYDLADTAVSLMHKMQ